MGRGDDSGGARSRSRSRSRDDRNGGDDDDDVDDYGRGGGRRHHGKYDESFHRSLSLSFSIVLLEQFSIPSSIL